MKDILADKLLIAAGHLERLNVLYDERSQREDWAQFKDNPMSASVRNSIADSYKTIAEAAETMGAPVTQKSAERAVRHLKARKEPVTYGALKPLNDEIYSRLHDEIGSARFYCLTTDGNNFYSPDAPLFGLEVEARIPKASDDISEAGKCFGVGRYTASVFHLMRAMESAVQTLSGKLKIDNVERVWGQLLSDIHVKIEAMSKGEERDDGSQVHANLYHVKQAWRNDTMHPKATYTEEEAREVFDAVKAFMRHLATMLPPSLEEIIGVK